MSDNHFGADVAASYDADHGGTDPALVRETVDLLAELAEGGDILEFAIGTGRIALPLAALGCTVKGIELSAPMVAEMRKKEGGADIDVAIGDMTTTQMPGDFTLVVLVFNTLDNLTTQDAQVACFANAAAHLAPGGRFVVETLIPPLQRLPFGETKLAFAADPDHMGIDVFDVVTQNYASHHVWTKADDVRPVTIPFRYAWPAEQDLMAQLAGMTLEHRWSDWQRSPFTKDSTKHVSVWRKPA